MEEKIEPQPLMEPEAEPSVPSLWEKLKANKFKILGGVLGVFVFAGAVFGAYRLGQRQIQPTPAPSPAVVATPTPDPTANWKTYTNTKYGYLIKYPKNWVLRPDEQVPDQIVNFKNIEELYRLSSNLSIYSGGAHTEAPPSAVFSETKPVTIAGKEAMKEVYEKPYGEEGLFEWIKFSGEQKVGQIAIYKHGEGREHSDTLNLMLSTFRFLEEEIESQEKCEYLGGKWTFHRAHALDPKFAYCILPTSDAGKSCTSNSQCESVLCVAEDMNSTSGTCYGWSSAIGWCGLALVEENKVKSYCID